MKQIIFFLVSLLFLQGLSAQASKTSSPNNESSSGSGNFGLGLTLFGPTGVTGKYQMNDKLSIEGGVGLGLFGHGRFHLHGVLLYNFYKVNDSLSVYGGGGGVMEERGGKKKDGIAFLNNDSYQNSLGIRAPIGISWKKADKKFELSAEIYVNVFLIGRDGTNAGLALAGRYYF